MNALSVTSLAVGGELRGLVHLLPVRIYYEDTDAAGLVYHANYLRFCERGRTEMLRALGVELGQVQTEDNLVFVVHRADIEWKRPARLDDVLTVETALTGMGRARLSLRQVIRRDDEEIVKFNVDVACMDIGTRRATPVPDHLRSKFQAFIRKI